ncbi:MAG: DUF2911 domain-containing protein [Acidobacteria bacterium]|nr:DUF2911 domain-containing protein [Acidobacteriota bacterium]
MRKTFVAVAALALTVFMPAGVLATRTLRAQGGRVSPHESVSATVIGAQLTIVYGRPSMRGRTIFGSLVPYDRV